MVDKSEYNATSISEDKTKNTEFCGDLEIINDKHYRERCDDDELTPHFKEKVEEERSNHHFKEKVEEEKSNHPPKEKVEEEKSNHPPKEKIEEDISNNLQVKKNQDRAKRGRHYDEECSGLCKNYDNKVFKGHDPQEKESFEDCQPDYDEIKNKKYIIEPVDASNNPEEEQKIKSKNAYDLEIGINNFQNFLLRKNPFPLSFPSTSYPDLTRGFLSQFGVSQYLVFFLGKRKSGKTFIFQKFFEKEIKFQMIGYHLILIKFMKKEYGSIIFIDFQINERAIDNSPDYKTTFKEINDVIISMSDLIITVLEAFDKKKLRKIQKKVNNLKKDKDIEIFVIYNNRCLNDNAILEDSWSSYVKNVKEVKTQITIEIKTVRIKFLSANKMRHTMIINDECPYGKFYNQGVIKYLIDHRIPLEFPSKQEGIFKRLADAFYTKQQGKQIENNFNKNLISNKSRMSEIFNLALDGICVIKFEDSLKLELYSHNILK